MMVTLGTDAHKRSHTIVAVDTAGAEIGSVTVPSRLCTMWQRNESWSRSSLASSWPPVVAET